MSRFWSNSVHRLHPYVPGEQPAVADLVKLNTNENPYGPSPRAEAAIAAAAGDALRLYPDPEARDLRAALAARAGLTADHVFVGNGSDEVLAHTFKALLDQDEPLLFPDITYSFYPVYCGLFDITFEALPLDQSFNVQLADYAERGGPVILPNPNAPTGIALPLPAIEELVAGNPGRIVVVDEAYADFAEASAARLVERYPNLLVIQTFSKSRALAGLRVGFAFGHPDLVAGLVRVKDSFNSYPLSRPAQAGAKAALDDEAWFEANTARIIAGRQDLTTGLERRGFQVLPSSANFVFARHLAIGGAELAASLRARHILVRHWAKPRIADFLRISVGTEANHERLFAALDEILPG